MKEGGEYYEMILLLDSERIEKIEKICYNKKAKSLIVESRTRKKIVEKIKRQSSWRL